MDGRIRSLGVVVTVAGTVGALAGALTMLTFCVSIGQVKPYESGLVWEEPPKITPAENGKPPSDAIVLFDGTNLDAWEGGEKCKIEQGAFEVHGWLRTKQSFGDCQLHLEFATPTEIMGRGQGRGNNGVGFMDARYEVQILDSWENPTYLDGMCAAIYKQRPPMINAARPPGQWQTYDIVFEAPRFRDGQLQRPAYVTVFWNGVLAHNHVQLLGDTPHDRPPNYKPHPEKLPLALMYHGNPVRFRNIWIRELRELKATRSP